MNKKKWVKVVEAVNPFSKTNKNTPETKDTEGKTMLFTTLLDETKKKEFEKVVQERMADFVEANGNFDKDSQQTPETVTSALVHFVVSLYNHVMEKGLSQYDKTQKINILNKFLNNLSFRDKKDKGCANMCAEADKEKLPRHAYNLFNFMLFQATQSYSYKNYETPVLRSLINDMKEMPAPYGQLSKVVKLEDIDLDGLVSTENKDDFEKGQVYDGVINNIQSKVAYVTFNKEDTIKGRIRVDNKQLLKEYKVGDKIQVKIEDKPDNTWFTLSLVPTK